MKKIDTLIVGAGIAGLSVAYHLTKYGREYIIIDDNVGGLCSSFFIKGFTFDITGHVIHCRTNYYEAFIKEAMENNLIRLKRKAYFYYNGNYAPYPFQVFFYKLPEQRIVNECINGLKKVTKFASSPQNFKEWLIANFGEGISRHFLIPYNEKLWCFPLEKISLAWVNKFIPKPDPEHLIKMVEGGITEEKNYGYNIYFYYPKTGGIQEVINSVIRKINGNFDSSFINTRLVKVNLFEKRATFSDGTEIKWNVLVNTIPINEFVNLIKDIPKEIKFYARKLKYTSIISVMLGAEGELETDAHWIYFPQYEIPFHRVVVQSNLSSYIPPNGTYSLIVEKSFRPNETQNFSKKHLVRQIIRQLCNIGLIMDRDDILVTKVNHIKYAYPIYDLNWYKNRQPILDFLMNHQIFSIGRFGSWEYLSMEDAFLQGKDIVTRIV
ncbi:MAG: protoporphyrinogen/coproporphyrinogen oxidase [Candidatus Njordarchaeales archaeon]